MKALTKIAALVAITLGSIAQAADCDYNPFPDTDVITRYVTSGGCRVYTDRDDLDETTPGNQTVEIWLYLNKQPSDYNPNMDMRGQMYLNDTREARAICQELHQAYKAKKALKLAVTPHPYWKDNWNIKGILDGSSGRLIGNFDE